MLEDGLDNKIGSFRDRGSVRAEETVRQKLINIVDMRNEWSFKFPRKYVGGAKPKFVDWSKERVFKDTMHGYIDKSIDHIIGKKEKPATYFVIPKHQNYTKMPDQCRNCTEVFLKKK